MRRREFITLVGGAVATPLAVRAQQRSDKTARIGLLTRKTDASVSAQIDAFRQGLADLGWVEGRNTRIEHRDAEGQAERLPALAIELIRLNVDVILAPAPAHALAAMQATRTIPIVFVNAADPVANGLVTSLARPGGNVTGLSSLASELVGKRLELLKQAVPGVSRVAILRQPGGQGERTKRIA